MKKIKLKIFENNKELFININFIEYFTENIGAKNNTIIGISGKIIRVHDSVEFINKEIDRLNA